MTGYTPKDLYFDSDGRDSLISGVVKLSKAVKSTLGAAGNTVLIESPFHSNGITVTKDGVTVARSIDLSHPVENLAVKMVKEAADRTATTAGDGTTTSVLLTEALVVNGTNLITPDLSRTEVLRNIQDSCEYVVGELRKMATPVTDEMVQNVANISANNDMGIGTVISDVYKEVGVNGIVTVERSETSETYSEITKGLRIERGFTSPMFINDQKKDQCILDDVMVLVSDIEIGNVLQIENVLKPIIQDGKRLLMIAPVSAGVLNTLAANVVRGNLRCCVVAPPNFGHRQSELMQDLAISVGATYFSEKTGDDLSLINYEHLGHATKMIADQFKTIIIKSDVKSNQDVIDQRVNQLREAHAIAQKKSDKDFLMERIASLTGGIGVIFVGGNTDIEQKELYDRVDDAVCAVRSALEEGILPGSGVPLYEIGRRMLKDISKDREKAVANKIVAESVCKPLEQILENAGLKASEVYKKFGDGMGYDLKARKWGKMVDMGIVDPLKVTRSALQNAVSVAVTILSTNAIVTMGRTMEIGDLNEAQNGPKIKSAKVIS